MHLFLCSILHRWQCYKCTTVCPICAVNCVMATELTVLYDKRTLGARRQAPSFSELTMLHLSHCWPVWHPSV